MAIKQNKISKKEVIGMVFYIFLIASLIFISPYLPDERPGAIRRELARQGYPVDQVDFEFVRDGDRRGEWLFQSSEPLYSNGHSVSEWAVVRYERGFSWPYICYIYSVEPYPSFPEVV